MLSAGVSLALILVNLLDVLVYLWLKLAMYICILGIGLVGLCGGWDENLQSSK